MPATIETPPFYFIGNNLSLDFINTEVMASGQRKDLLGHFADFVQWCQAAALLEPPQAARLLADWPGRTAEQALAEIRAFRHTLRQMVEGIIQGEGVQPATVTAINQRLRDQSGFAELRQTPAGFERVFHTVYAEPGRLLTPIAEAAVALLCYSDLGYLKQCESPSCILYFYDTTKNHSRRWCSMAACGNRAKAAAYYQRHSGKE